MSRDAGRSYENADLPTGPCHGVTNVSQKPECAFANSVTDVVVSQPGGKNTTTSAGTVVATVGWRGGQKKNRDGSVQSPRNGVYRSATGAAGSFSKLAVTGFANQDAIGRTELGQAVGAKQDHDVLYAMVQDANLLNNGGVFGIDVPEGSSSPLGTTVLNGLYVSTDFGTTWSRLASGTQLAADPTTGSALVGTGQATGYQPGVQGWYNLWVQPDPTRATATGVPTRLAFGLEEIWSNDVPQVPVPLDGSVPAKFRVVAKYFGGDSCLLLSAGLPTCPGDREPTDNGDTTHPDQQEGIWVPDAAVDGGVQLVVGNDGGTYRYRFESDDDGELDNSHWGPGDQQGYGTLLPYIATMAKDGTVYGGLQDNGNLKIDGGTRKQYETYGGDGFFSAVDPADSDTTYEEYTNAAISVSTDGGSSWKSMDPGLTASKFSNPFVMDPKDANHLVTAGREVVETLVGPSTTDGMTNASDADASTDTWIKVFDLGTRAHPGDANATSSDHRPGQLHVRGRDAGQRVVRRLLRPVRHAEQAGGRDRGVQEGPGDQRRWRRRAPEGDRGRLARRRREGTAEPLRHLDRDRPGQREAGVGDPGRLHAALGPAGRDGRHQRGARDRAPVPVHRRRQDLRRPLGQPARLARVVGDAARQAAARGDRRGRVRLHDGRDHQGLADVRCDAGPAAHAGLLDHPQAR